jgi:Fn3 associated
MYFEILNPLKLYFGLRQSFEPQMSRSDLFWASPPYPQMGEYIASKLDKLLAYYLQFSSKLQCIFSGYLGCTPPFGGRGGIAQNILIFALFLLNFAAQAQDTFQLATPILHYKSAFFTKKTEITLLFAQKGTEIHYTLTGKAPTENDLIYKKTIQITENTTLKTRVYGNGFKPSDIVEAKFFNVDETLQYSITGNKPHEYYTTADGLKSLADNRGGIPEQASKTWLGYCQDSVIFNLSLLEKKKPKEIMLNVFNNQNSWIYLPQKVEVYYKKKHSEQLILVASQTIDANKKEEKAACESIVFNFKKKVKTSEIVVKVYPLAKIPEGNAGNGSLSWFFIDELKLY